jgi:uncharacterized protein YbjT (DUF2867 family)
MRIQVIGGTQFIGRQTVQRLLQRGHEVTVPHRRDRHDLGSDGRNLQADRGDSFTMDRVLRDGRFDAVFDICDLEMW